MGESQGERDLHFGKKKKVQSGSIERKELGPQCMKVVSKKKMESAQTEPP